MTREPLREAAKIQRKAARQGFDWPQNDPRLWHKLAEEIRELRAVRGNRQRARDELGDLLFMVVNLSRHLKVDAPRALAGAIAKFQRRYAYVLRHAHELPPRNDPRRLESMEVLWCAAKRREKPVAKGARNPRRRHR